LGHININTASSHSCKPSIFLISSPASYYGIFDILYIFYLHPVQRYHRTVSKRRNNKIMWNSTSGSTPSSPTVASPTTVSRPTYKMKHQGRRVAQIVKLKPEHVEEYKACHARVWPEVLKQIKDCNIEDCKPSSPFIPSCQIPDTKSVTCSFLTWQTLLRFYLS
jgi:hypothetical protein